MIDDERLLRILSIAHRTSMRGEGVSLSQALADTGYRAMRLQFDVDDLRRVVESNPELLDQWSRYSDDKRTDGGWYLKTSDSVIGSLAEKAEIRFGSVAEAVANYAIRELDFWFHSGAT